MYERTAATLEAEIRSGRLGAVGSASALGIAMSLIIFGITFGIRALIERNAT